MTLLHYYPIAKFVYIHIALLLYCPFAVLPYFTIALVQPSYRPLLLASLDLHQPLQPHPAGQP